MLHLFAALAEKKRELIFMRREIADALNARGIATARGLRRGLLVVAVRKVAGFKGLAAGEHSSVWWFHLR